MHLHFSILTLIILSLICGLDMLKCSIFFSNSDFTAGKCNKQISKATNRCAITFTNSNNNEISIKIM